MALPRKLILMLDNPCEEHEQDGLNLRVLAETIAGAALGNNGPFTVGVFGEWGSGKTSVLHMAKQYVEADESVVAVWFNAWQFEREAEPLFSLMSAVLDAIDLKLDGSIEAKTSNAFGTVRIALRAVARGMKFKGEVGMPLVGKVGVEFDAAKALEAEEVFGNQMNPLQAELLFASAFRVLTEWANKLQVKVVVFVDDLDRCDPEKAVHLLESIKLILWQKGFVFVLALDEQIITSYLLRQYVSKHALDEKIHWGEKYLEKIVNLPLRVPRYERGHFDHYVDKRIQDLVEQHPPEERDSSALKALQDAKAAISIGADANPRAFVRQVNRFLVACRLYLASQSKDHLDPSEAMAIAMDITLTAKLGDSLTHDLAHDQRLCDEILEELKQH